MSIQRLTAGQDQIGKISSNPDLSNDRKCYFYYLFQYSKTPISKEISMKC